MRGQIAINKLDLLQIKPRPKSQPCEVFGLNPVMPNLKRIYDEGDAAMIANMGALVEPVTKQEFKEKAKRLPPSLFAHNIQQRVMASVWAQYSSAGGVVGRIMSSLRLGRHEAPYKVGLYSLDGNQKIIEGSTSPNFVDGRTGVKRFTQYETLKDDIHKLTSEKSHSLFAETASEQLEATLKNTESLGQRLESTLLKTDEAAFTSNVAKQFLQVAKLIKIDKRDLEMERSGFVTTLGGFDTHNTAVKYDEHMANVDTALGLFEAEMKAQGLWDAVTILTVSDFGRTLTFNGLGTDHAWGGNYFVMGGNVSGAQIHGKYPDRLIEEESDVNIGRGRILPTLPWESMWEGLSQWMGVHELEIPGVLPNLKNFAKKQRLTMRDLFGVDPITPDQAPSTKAPATTGAKTTGAKTTGAKTTGAKTTGANSKTTGAKTTAETPKTTAATPTTTTTEFILGASTSSFVSMSVTIVCGVVFLVISA